MTIPFILSIKFYKKVKTKGEGGGRGLLSCEYPL